jgi:hypothetical protein
MIPEPFTVLLAAALLVAIAAAIWMAEPTIPGPQDEQLRLDGAAGAAATTQTASTNSTALDMGSGFAPSGIGMPVAGLVNVTAADRAQSDETYNFKLQESSDNSAWTDICANVAVPVSGATATLGVVVCKGLLSKRYVRLVSTIAGTTPSVTFKAWLHPRPLR